MELEGFIKKNYQCRHVWEEKVATMELIGSGSELWDKDKKFNGVCIF